MKNIYLKSGLTIIEVLLSVAIILVLSIATVGYFRGKIVEVSLESTVKTLVSDINSAKLRAMAGDKGMDWGIVVNAGDMNNQGSWGLFASSSSVSTEIFHNEVNNLPYGVSWIEPSSGNKSVFFRAITGNVSSTTFILGNNEIKYEIKISESGEIYSNRL